MSKLNLVSASHFCGGACVVLSELRGGQHPQGDLEGGVSRITFVRVGVESFRLATGTDAHICLLQ